MRLPSLLRSLTRNRHAILGATLRHPFTLAVQVTRSREKLGTFLAWDFASQALNQQLPHVPPQQDMRTLESLNSYLRARGKEWPKWDPSEMTVFKGPLLYFLVRIYRPESVIETGTASGVSTCFILQALCENRNGRLVSIDLPNASSAAELPPSKGSGWLVPETLRSGWTLELGDSRYLLPESLSRNRPVDIFVHDSLHTYDHMLWEFGMAWKNLHSGGLLVSDDIYANNAFREFCHNQKRRGHELFGMGILRKYSAVNQRHERP